MIRAICGASLFLWMSCAGSAQTPSIRSFEVASVELHEGPMYRLGVSTAGLRLTADAVNVRALLVFAFHLRNFQVSIASPLVTADARYDIVAKAAGDRVPTWDEFRQMMQSLLADRFQLKFHHESREIPVYALVVDKNGPKLKESAPDADPTQHYGASGRNTVVTMPKATMAGVVDGIENSFLDRPVLDKTGLTGTYDIKLTFTPQDRASQAMEPNPNDISIFTAVRDQLGLRLEPQKATVEILVVDHVAKPSGN